MSRSTLLDSFFYRPDEEVGPLEKLQTDSAEPVAPIDSEEPQEFLAFSLAGDRFAGVWELSSSQVSWVADSAQLKSASLVERTVWQVVSGLGDLRVRAELGGTVDAPTLRVSSNLDDAVATRLRGLATDALAKGEHRARQAVDSLVNKQVAQLRGQVNGLSSQLADKVPVERGKLDSAQRSLEAELKRYAGSALGGLRLP